MKLTEARQSFNILSELEGELALISGTTDAHRGWRSVKEGCRDRLKTGKSLQVKGLEGLKEN